jgi:hypothetical protein
MARYEQDSAQAEAAMARVQTLMATADDNLREAVARLEAAESETADTPEQSEDVSRRVNELDAEVERLQRPVSHRGAGELGAVVAAQHGRVATHGRDAVQFIDQVLTGDRAIDQAAEAFAGVFIDDRQVGGWRVTRDRAHRARQALLLAAGNVFDRSGMRRHGLRMSWQRGGDEGGAVFPLPVQDALAVAVVQEHRSRSRRLIGEVKQRQRPALEKVEAARRGGGPGLPVQPTCPRGVPAGQ